MNGYLCPLASSSRSARSKYTPRIYIVIVPPSKDRESNIPDRCIATLLGLFRFEALLARARRYFNFIRRPLSLSLFFSPTNLSLPELCELNFAASTPVVWQDPRRTGRCLTEDYHRSIIPNRILRARPDPINGRKKDDSHARGFPSFLPCSLRVFDACHGFCREIALFLALPLLSPSVLTPNCIHH